MALNGVQSPSTVVQIPPPLEEIPVARPRKNPTGEAGDAGAATTASGNTHRRTQKRTLSGRIGAMERKLDHQGEILQRIARGVS